MQREIKYNFNHVNGVFFEMLEDGGFNDTYKIVFWDRVNERTVFESEIKPQTWVKLNRRYLSDLDILIMLGDKIVFEKNVKKMIQGGRVFISFDSKSLGDTLAWMPVCEEFRKQYDCEVIVSTFMNEQFIPVYPYLKFVGRGVTVDNLTAMFELGWFYDKDKEPQHPATIPLQKAASNILGLQLQEELIAQLAFDIQPRPIMQKYVCISTQSTAQLKHWHYWQELIDMLKDDGYEVCEISKEPTELKGLCEVKDKSLASVKNYLFHCDFFIGLSSGISWLAWAMRRRVYMIAGFTRDEHEFQSNCVRIANRDVCNGCWNNPMFKFDKSNWLYCPEHEDTPRQFECHKMITALDVYNAIKNPL